MKPLFATNKQDILPTLTGLDAIAAINRINRAVSTEMSKKSPNTVRGNQKPTLYIGGPWHDPEYLVHTETHGVFRQMVGHLGQLFDPASLSEHGIENVARLDDSIAAHREQMQKLKIIHENFALRWEEPKMYLDGDQLIANLREPDDVKPRERKKVEAIVNKLKRNNGRTNGALKKLDKELRAIPAFHLKGQDEPILNKDFRIRKETYIEGGREFNKRTSRAEWFFYASYAARHVLDTTHHPWALSDAIDSVMGNGKEIITVFGPHLRASTDLQVDPVTNILQNTVEKIQDRIVQCGSYKDITTPDYSRKLVHIAGIYNKNIYDAVTERVEIKKAAGVASKTPQELAEMRKNTVAVIKCPFKHGQT